MRRMHRVFLLFMTCFLAPAFAQTSSAVAPAITEAELVERTQKLYDSLPAGDRAPWALYYAEDVMVFDEKGRSMNKKAFLADMEPMPRGYSGSIKVEHPHTVFAPGVAVFAYECDETETIFGQQLRARYHSVDTWLYRKGSWQVSASQTMRYYEDPAAGKTDEARIGDFTGIYELAPGDRRTVSIEGSYLYIQRNAGVKTRLVPESGDVFFRTGVEGRILFHRGPAGEVDAIYDRRNNEDIVWKKQK